MADLTHEGALKFWREYKDPAVYRVVTFMESMEDWTLDGHDDLEQALKKLGTTLDKAGKIDLQKEEDFINVATYIKSSRMLRLLQCLDSAHPGAASKLLTYAERVTESTEDPAGLFLRRNVVFERLRLIKRIFAENRFALIQNALEDEDVG